MWIFMENYEENIEIWKNNKHWSNENNEIRICDAFEPLNIWNPVKAYSWFLDLVIFLTSWLEYFERF